VPRSYEIPVCPIARTLDLIGERWTLLLLRDFHRKGPLRFQDLQEAFPAAAPNTLSQRLKDLEAHDLIEREVYSEHPPRLRYRLTRRGASLKPVLAALREWGEQNT
jgi:DNA-binding HxlR family transcriptional regulator